VPHRHRSWAAGAGPGAVPRRGLLSLEWGTLLRHRTWPPERAGDGARSGRSPAGGARRPSDCAARGGSTGLHSGLRTGRVAGLLCRPRAGRLVHGCRAVGAVPGRQRHGGSPQWAVLGVVPAGPPRPGVRAGARTAAQVKIATPAAGRGSRAGRRTGPARVSWELAYPQARAVCRVSQAAGGVLTGPRPAPSAVAGREGRARTTRTTLRPELRAGSRGRAEPESLAAGRARADSHCR
jgi:hypothetical protein